MAALARVTVSMPPELVSEMDRWEDNRSRFVVEAVRREIERRRREELARSLADPHPDTVALAETGLAAWADGIPEGADLLAADGGVPLEWGTPGSNGSRR